MFLYSSNIICADTDNNNISICISNDNTVYSFGYSKFGSHGHKKKKINIPTKIQELSNIQMIDCGCKHTICLDFNGNIFSFGSNEEGQLGIGKSIKELKYTYKPQKINLPPCKQVSCGDNFTICLTEDNILYSFGGNFNGQLGIGNNKNYSSPQEIKELNNISYIVCGRSHAICKTFNNEYYSWGHNFSGELGQGHSKSCKVSVQCNNWPDNIVSIKCGCFISFLLTSEGQVYSFGKNSDGQQGTIDNNINYIPELINNLPEIKRIEYGYYYPICIDIHDNLWVFGNNRFGQLGLGDTEHRYKPIKHPTLSNIIDISSKGYHTFVKTKDNKIYAFGCNINRQLGIKTVNKKQSVPIQVLENKEDIWCSKIGNNRAKSARK